MTGLPANATPARYIRPGYLGQLNAEWVEHLATRALPRAWTRASLQLETVEDLAGLLVWIASADSLERDRVLHALLRANRDGESLAGRVLLQTMLGRVQRLAHTARGRGLEDPVAAAAAAMWAAIATYPLHRRTAVASNLAMESLRALPRPVKAPLAAGEALEGLIHHEQSCGRLSADFETDPGQQAQATLLWALDTGALSGEEVRLLTRSYLQPTSSTEELAAELKISAAAVKMRRSRAVRRLGVAVRAHLGDTD